jgi:hypothetical protein
VQVRPPFASMVAIALEQIFRGTTENDPALHSTGAHGVMQPLAAEHAVRVGPVQLVAHVEVPRRSRQHWPPGAQSLGVVHCAKMPSHPAAVRHTPPCEVKQQP